MEDASDKRKNIPLYSGLVRYFPDALCEVAKLSKAGSDKHNGIGSPMRWTREKSADHPDALTRHLIDLGERDSDGFLHATKVAWRALAILQLALEQEARADESAKLAIAAD